MASSRSSSWTAMLAPTGEPSRARRRPERASMTSTWSRVARPWLARRRVSLPRTRCSCRAPTCSTPWAWWH
eukprot:1613618-Pyramimonas_sp.AAC.1